jgi:hypothetical protein
MKNGFVVSLVLIMVLCAAGAFAAQPLGGPPESEKGKWSADVGYWYSQDKWTSNTLSGSFDPKVATYSYYGQVGYGVANGWDVYLRAGALDAKLLQSNADFDVNGKFFVGAGTHGTLFQKKEWNLALGPIANFTYYSNWTDRGGSAGNAAFLAATGTGISSVTVKDHYSVNVGFGFRWQPLEFLQIYGGPFYNYETAKLESVGRIRGFPVATSGSNVNTDKSFGSRLGIRIPIKDFSINFEAQMKDYFGAGGWLSFQF